MKISPGMKAQLQSLYDSTLNYLNENFHMMEDLSPYAEKIVTTHYTGLPEGIFGDDAHQLRTNEGLRRETYEARNDEATITALKAVDAVIEAECEYLTYHTLRNNARESTESRMRLTAISKYVDDFENQADNVATWIDAMLTRFSPAFIARHATYVDRRLTPLEIENHVSEQAVLRYAQASKAFVSNSDLHGAMIVMQLSDRPASKGDPDHRRYFQSISDETEAARKMMEIAVQMYPDIQNSPDFAAQSSDKPRNRLN